METESNQTSTASNDSTMNPSSEIIPQLTTGDDNNVTFQEVQTAVKVLKAVAALTKGKNKKRTADGNDKSEDPGIQAYKHSNLRPLRKALASCLELHQRTMYDGKSADEYFQAKIQERSVKRQKMAERDQQKKYIADSALRRGRIEKLREKQSEAQEEEMAKIQQMMIPDGHVETIMNTDTTRASSQRLLTAEEPEETKEPKSELTQDPVRLPKLRSCYVCKIRFREMHHFYDQLCPTCAALNWEKRHQTANLDGKVAVVTGSRVKIGYQTCLKLLRAGATVVATTRFPNLAAATYRNESDFDQWKHRLHVYGLDLRDVTGLEAFCRFLKMRYSESGLDILINNACQTVRRPTAYYLPACQKEEELWKASDETHKGLLDGCLDFERVRRQLLLDHKRATKTPSNQIEAGTQPTMPMLANGSNEDGKKETESSTAMVTTVKEDEDNNATVPFEETGMSHSAAMSQMILLPEDAGVSDSVLPPGVTDINGQQLDLRKSNSWLLKMEQVSTPEVMECMYINAIAPFVLNSRLKPLMSVPNPHADRYVVNVSAMEGKFYRYKMSHHPHTNMAKAALNMMTRTSAEDLAKNHGIYMNSVDTGWINDENPLERATKTAENNLFQTPIDEIDAAARILDPIFVGVNEPKQNKDYGKFLKDYKETEW